MGVRTDRRVSVKGQTASLLFLAVCGILVTLLLTRSIPPIVSGAVFAVALVVLGGFSRGFRRE
jgi:hypothetical protein